MLNTVLAADKRINDGKNRSDLDTAKLVLKTKLRKLNNSKIGSKINDFGKNKLHFNGKSIGRKLKIKLREDIELYRYYNEMM